MNIIGRGLIMQRWHVIQHDLMPELKQERGALTPKLEKLVHVLDEGGSKESKLGRIGVALQPLSDRLAELLRQRPCLHADETPVRQLDPGAGKTRQAYLWAYRSNDFDTGPPIVVFDYQTGRAGAHARAFLAGWQGYLMVDDFSGYKKLFTNGVTELACLVHIRRNFFKLHQDQGSPIAAEALRRIGLLYAIEQEGRELTVQARLQLRQQYAKPLLADLCQQRM